MIQQINIQVSPWHVGDELVIKQEICRIAKISIDDISTYRIIRKSVDARGRNIKFNLGVEVFVGEFPSDEHQFDFRYDNVTEKEHVIIVGAGPAGLFAALRLIELGLKPIIFERGKDVSARKRDIAAIHRGKDVDPDSNYGFGEGGAGTFSDGKLYTRSKKRGDNRRILEILFDHGAQPEILIEAHPHIGTNVLPRVIKKIRETILASGGNIFFESKVVDFIIESGTVAGVVLFNGEIVKARAVILATGHSARDIYTLLKSKGIHIEAKNFAMGVRVEHPQALIDEIQYKRPSRGKYLPPASYSFVEQVDGRGVYSFCMCPGGMIVPAATSPGEFVVNGMSPSGRNGHFANSGIVVEIRIEDLTKYAQHREIAGLHFQEEIEKKCFSMAKSSQLAPAQRITDFLNNKNSTSLPATSYRPGLITSDLHAWLPSIITGKLQKGLSLMGNKAKGFISEEAVVVGVESRTSSPVRIPRDESTLEHIKVKGLFPCGEGAGYAGGIVSSAIDGERCAEKVAEKLK